MNLKKHTRKMDDLRKIEFCLVSYMGITTGEIYSRSRRPEFVLTRQLVWSIAWRRLGFSYAHLARIYERDHTTVMHGIQKKIGSDDLQEAEKVVKTHFPEMVKTWG